MTGTLLYADSHRDANIYYATDFLAPDPFIFIEGNGNQALVVPGLEAERARKESRITDVRSFDDVGYRDYLNETHDRILATAAVMGQLIGEFSLTPCTVAPTFPVVFADILRQGGAVLEPDPELYVSERRRKSDREVGYIAQAQVRAERSLQQATEILAESETYGDSLVFRGLPLTSERLRAEIEVDLIRDGYVSESSIVGPGPRSSDPHWEGSGPIFPNQPLILDFFPRNRQNRYHGDVTRTLVRGEPTDQVKCMHVAVLRAQNVALEMIGPGVNGHDVHDAVVRSFHESGYADEGSGPRFIHGTGHGLGLEVHELPTLSLLDVELAEGDVVTVEPGLYDPEVGGVRLEDVVVVTPDGNRNLNSFPKDLVV